MNLKPKLDEVEEERSVMFDQVASQIMEWSYAEPDRPYFTTFYLEQDALYGLFNDRGVLYRGAINLSEDGQTVTVGEMEQVIHEFTPVSRSALYTIRQADGRTRFFMVAGTAIINRVGEIDSTKLYDDMIQRAESSGYYPTLDFYHLGEVDPVFEFGQFDFLAREGVVYVGSGLFEEDHPLSTATERALKQDGEKWGASIEYYRPENRGIEYVEVGEGLEIAAYTEGLNTRISILPERAAAAWFTSLAMEKREMTDQKLKALRDLFGDDKEGYEAFIAKFEGINKEVRDKGLIHRAKEEPAKTEEPAAQEAAEEIVLDDEAIDAIVEVAKRTVENEVLGTVTALLNGVTATLEQLTAGQTQLLATVNGMQERVGSLEQEDEAKQRTWLGDLPAKKQTPTRVTYRPRDQRTEEPVEQTSADKAASVLNGLPKVGFVQ